MDVADKFISEKCCLPLLLYIVFAVSVCLSMLCQPSFVYCRGCNVCRSKRADCRVSLYLCIVFCNCGYASTQCPCMLYAYIV